MHQPRWPLWDHIDGNKKYSQELPSFDELASLVVCKVESGNVFGYFRSVGGRGNSAKQAPPPPEEADAARKRFGNAKSISSSQFNSEDDQSGNNYEKEVRAFYLEYSLGDLCAGPFQAIPASIERVEKAEKVDFRRQQFLGGQLCIRPNQCVGHFSVPFTSLL